MIELSLDRILFFRETRGRWCSLENLTRASIDISFKSKHKHLRLIGDWRCVFVSPALNQQPVRLSSPASFRPATAGMAAAKLWQITCDENKFERRPVFFYVSIFHNYLKSWKRLGLKRLCRHWTVTLVFLLQYAAHRDFKSRQYPSGNLYIYDANSNVGAQ